MLNNLVSEPQRVLVIGDVFVSPDTMEKAIRKSKINVQQMKKAFWGNEDKKNFTKMQLNIERNGPEAENYAKGIDEVIEEIDVIVTHFCPLPQKLIQKAKSLKIVLTCRGGLEHIDVSSATERNIPVFNVIRNAEPVAEFALGMIIAMTRNIAISHKMMMDSKWPKVFVNSEFTTTLSEMTVGLAGLGNVGIALALKLKALGIHVMAFDAFVTKEQLVKNGIHDIEMVPKLENIFQKSDVVSLHFRLTDDNGEMINKHYFSLMKPTSYFLNTARGGLVNQKDLIEVLEKRKIAGAGLDVYDKEPLSYDCPLLKLENVVLTSHIAGTTVDAIPKSPYLLMKELDKMLSFGVTDRIVNFNEIEMEK